MSAAITLPTRSDVKTDDTWDLSSLYSSDADWEAAFTDFEKQVEGYARFQGTLGQSAQAIAQCLRFDSDLDRRGERLGTYAFLKTTEDQANSDYQGMMQRYQNVAVRAGQAASFIRPELLAIDTDRMNEFMSAPELAHFQLMLERIVRYKPHTLGQKEEELLAMQGQMAQAANQAFRQLVDTDLKFGTVRDQDGQDIELTNSTFMQLLHSADRNVRKTAFHQFYDQYAGHENTLVATLNGSIQRDVYYARARGYDSALASSLFADNVPESVYTSLISSVRDHLPALFKYYEVRRRAMQLEEIHHYDTYVPILSDLESNRCWDEAVRVVMHSLAPLGEQYCAALQKGLTGRWCDRYPNKGKQSGAFSCGTFDGDPFILMNYKPEVLDDVFTLTHEAGHSMHSYYSSSNQPYDYYDYVIFVAEVASTFNEQLLSHHMMQQASSDKERAYLINREIDGIRGTIIRQTMFAEFEKVTHEMAERGEPLTVQSIKQTYHALLTDYFGAGFTIDDQLSLECLRIPHFYRAFYVYKYATGLSAAIALSQRVLHGGATELTDYMNFLKGGCSKDPLDLLRDAGVDMESPEPVNAALEHFGQLVDELDSLLG